MNEEVLKEVLAEILEEQKILNINNGLITKAVEDFFEKLSDVENVLSNIKESSGADLQIINTNLQKLKTIIEVQSKEIIHKKRILFFPETYKQEFYKIVFGTVVKLVAIVLVTLFSFFFLKDLFIQQDNGKYKTVWEWLYQHQGNKGKKVMDSAMFNLIKSNKYIHSNF
jgi:predicted PurR-regulated permease PerM